MKNKFVWFIILALVILGIVWAYNSGYFSEKLILQKENSNKIIEGDNIKNLGVEINYAKLIFYDNKTGCKLNGEISIEDNLIGQVEDGFFNLSYEDYQEKFYLDSELLITGLTDNCFEKDNNLPYLEIWTIPDLDYYFENDEPIEFSTELTPRSPRYYGERMGFVRPEEVKEDVNKIYFPNDIEKERIEKIVNYVESRIRYYDDYLLFKQSDYWQTPAETLSRNEGDCEDWATMTLSLILADNPNAQCYNVHLPTHMSLFCYSGGVVGFYDQEGTKSRTSLMRENEGEDKIEIRKMIYEYFKIYGIPPNERGVYAIFNDKELVTFENNEEFVEWIYGLF